MRVEERGGEGWLDGERRKIEGRKGGKVSRSTRGREREGRTRDEQKGQGNQTGRRSKLTDAWETDSLRCDREEKYKREGKKHVVVVVEGQTREKKGRE